LTPQQHDPSAVREPTVGDDGISTAVRNATWIIVPAFREGKRVGDVVRALRGLYPHVVVVDDGSDDDTSRRASEAGAVLVRHAVNRGQGAALQTGIEYALAAAAQYIVTFDSDGQHDVADVVGLLRPIVSGEADVALGSRFLASTAEVPRTRRAVLRGAVVFTRLTSGARVTDAHNGLRAFSRRAAMHIRITLDRMAHASEILDQIVGGGLRFVEVPVRIRYTAYSMEKGQRSTAALRIAVDYLFGRVFR
jgi:glycosyltransferase involved in cell wall biosynthesis